MKNILIIIALIMCAALTACGSKTQNTNSQGKTNDSNSSSSSASSDDEELTEVDPFDGLKVTFSGMVPDVEMSVIYKGKSRYVRQNIDFVVVSQPAVLKMGEKVIIKAEYKADTPVSERITLLQTEKEYDVEGIDEYVSSEFDSSEIDAAFDENLNNMLHNGEYTKIGNEFKNSENLFKDGDGYNGYMVKGYIVNPVQTCLEYVEEPQWDNEFHNRYIRVYEVQFVVEKVYESDPIPELSIDHSDGRTIGETYNSDVFSYCMYTDNVMISNGKVVYDTIKCNQDRNLQFFDRTWEKLRQDDISEHPTMQTVFEKDLDEQVTIKADTPVSENVTMLQAEKENDVEGIDEYVSSEFDSSEIDAAFEKELNNMLHNGEYTKIGKSNISARDLFSLKSYYEEHNEYMIKGYVITPVKTCLEYVEKPQWDNEFHNRYFRIYDVQFVVEKVSEADPIPELSIDYSDGRIIGETYNSDVFCYCMYTDNVMISNGKVVYDTIKCNQERGVAYFDRTWEKLRQDDINEHPTMQIVFEKDLS